jgi:hypothetical protein
MGRFKTVSFFLETMSLIEVVVYPRDDNGTITQNASSRDKNRQSTVFFLKGAN